MLSEARRFRSQLPNSELLSSKDKNLITFLARLGIWTQALLICSHILQALNQRNSYNNIHWILLFFCLGFETNKFLLEIPIHNKKATELIIKKILPQLWGGQKYIVITHFLPLLNQESLILNRVSFINQWIFVNSLFKNDINVKISSQKLILTDVIFIYLISSI